MSEPTHILVPLAQAGDAAALEEIVRRYQALAILLSKHLFLAGGDRDDIEQEARIAIIIAVRSYKPERGSFRPFLVLCVERWLVTCLVHARRDKSQVLNQAARTATDEEGRERPIVDLLADESADPALVVIRRERVREILERFKTLTELERESLVGYLNGESYYANKSADNAIQRARRKLAA